MWISQHLHPRKAPSRAALLQTAVCCAPLSAGSCKVMKCGILLLQLHDFSVFGSVEESCVPSREAGAGAVVEVVGGEDATRLKEALAWI